MSTFFSDFQINTEFYILVGIFFTLTLLITIIIVVFLTKIKSLKNILYQAKDIDEAKKAKIAKLEKELNSEKKKSEELSRELRFLPKNKERLEESMEYISVLKEQIKKGEKEHIKELNKQKLEFEQLSVHYELLNKSYIKLGERYKRLKDRNDILIEENNKFHNKLREMEIKRRNSII